MTSQWKALFLAGALTLAPALAAAQAQEPEQDRPPLFTRGDFIAAGTVTAATLVLTIFDDDIAMRLRQDDVRENSLLKTSRSYANRLNESTIGIGSLALYGIGRMTKQQTLADVSIHITEAVVVASVAAQLIRGPLGRGRPTVADSLNPDDFDQYIFEPFEGFSDRRFRAFPSIHTSSAFAAAAVLSGESAHRWPAQHKWIAPLAYAVAATPGLARMHLNEHWASDVLMGAFFGIMAGRKIVRYNHQVKPGNKVDRFLLGAGGVDPQNRTVLFEVKHRF